jgi:superoxide dismutase, Fe-Mn family
MEKSQAISRRKFLAGLGVTAGAIGLSTLTSCSKSSEKKHGAIDLVHGNDTDLFPVYKDGKYITKDFSALTKNPNLGLSPENISNHLGLYAGYVDKVNKSEEMMARNEVDDFSMKNLAFSLNGMALHDIYFSNMTTEKTQRSVALTKALENTFGSFDNFYANLVDTAMLVQGWSITGLNLLNGKLYNYAEDTHSSNFPAYVMPILVLDVYDHAWVKQFGDSVEAKKEYINIFSKIINWDLVSRRYDAITSLYS